MRKYPLIWFILATLVCVFPSAALALNSDLALYVDGEEQEMLHPLLYVDQEVYIAVDAAAQQFALEGHADEAKQEAELAISGTTYRFQVNEQSAVYGQLHVKMNAPALIKEDVFYIPLSFVADKLSMRLSWDAWTRSASLYKKSKLAPAPKDLFPTDPVVEQDKETNVLGAEKLPFNRDEPARLAGIGLEGGRLTVQTSGPVDVQPLYLSDPGGAIPDRLVLDVSYAMLQEEVNGVALSEGDSMLVNHPLIRQVRYAQFSQDPLIVRVVLDLKQPVVYQVTTGAESGFAVSLQGTGEAGAVYQVIIDPGHGGKDPGATGISKKEEKEFNLKVAKKVQAVLADHPQVNLQLTRADDTFISLDDRVKMANDWPADVFVSIHANTFERPISGTETYYWNANSLGLANLLHERLVESTGFEDRGVRKTAFKVVRETNVPAVLLEIGYLTNAEQEQKLLDNAFQDKVARTIADAILEYLNLS